MSQVTNIKDSRMSRFLDEAEKDYEAFEKEQEEWNKALEKYKEHPEVKGLIQKYRDIEASIGSDHAHEKMRVESLGLEPKVSNDFMRKLLENSIELGRLDEQIKTKIRDMEKNEGSNVVRFSQF